jgi:hypothetical protein
LSIKKRGDNSASVIFFSLNLVPVLFHKQFRRRIVTPSSDSGLSYCSHIFKSTPAESRSTLLNNLIIEQVVLSIFESSLLSLHYAYNAANPAAPLGRVPKAPKACRLPLLRTEKPLML